VINCQKVIEPEKGILHLEKIQKETKMLMKRIDILLKEHGMDHRFLVKRRVFLTGINDYQEVNRINDSFFKERYPAREAKRMANLSMGASIEISVIAYK
jgi:enamine deaminase RidA (YjgF/YER057c/UK114 family)